MKSIAAWILVIGIPLILIVDLILFLTGHPTISSQLWVWSGTSWGRLIPFAIGFLSCHLLLGHSGEG